MDARSPLIAGSAGSAAVAARLSRPRGIGRLAENLLVAAALFRACYDARLVLGDGAHDANHPGVLLPDTLRWLWR